MNPDQPELIRCTECGAWPNQPCFNLDQIVTVNGVTRRAVHAARYAANLAPGERQAFWLGLVNRYFDEQLDEIRPKKLASTSTEGETP